jgi:DNA-binding NarL/FixJ family response regulator
MLVADDDHLVRAGISAMLCGSEIEVAYQVSDGQEAVQCTLIGSPDLVLLDIRMPRTDGFQALEQIKQQRPEIPVLLMSAADNIEEIARGYRLGAAGFVHKSASCANLLQTIRRAVAQRSSWPRELLRRVRLMTPARDGRAVDGVWLTARQQAVLRRAAGGQSNEEIAEGLSMTVEAVRQHMKQVFRKIGCEDRTQAALWAIRHGLVEDAQSRDSTGE